MLRKERINPGWTNPKEEPKPSNVMESFVFGSWGRRDMFTLAEYDREDTYAMQDI